MCEERIQACKPIPAKNSPRDRGLGRALGARHELAGGALTKGQGLERRGQPTPGHSDLWSGC